MKKLKRQKFRYPPLFCEKTLNAVTLGDFALIIPVFCTLEVFSAKNLVLKLFLKNYGGKIPVCSSGLSLMPSELRLVSKWRRLEGWAHHPEFQRLQLVLGLAPDRSLYKENPCSWS